MYLVRRSNLSSIFPRISAVMDLECARTLDDVAVFELVEWCLECGLEDHAQSLLWAHQFNADYPELFIQAGAPHRFRALEKEILLELARAHSMMEEWIGLRMRPRPGTNEPPSFFLIRVGRTDYLLPVTG